MQSSYVCMHAGTSPSDVQQASQNLHKPAKLLTDWASILLRGLYERNARQSYCPAALWLEPYRATEMGFDFSAAAVVRALAQGQSNLG